MDPDGARAPENQIGDDLADPLVADAFADPRTPDGALLRAAAAGSRQAFALVVRRYEYAAYAWAVHVVETEEKAIELCRELFHRAWLQAPSMPHDVSRWLLEIGFEVATEMGATDVAPTRDFDALWLGGVVYEALEHVPDTERDLLLDRRSAADETDRMSMLVGLQSLRELLAARGIVRQGR